MTDFGRQGPYIGQMKAVLYRKAPGVPVVNLFSDLPTFNPEASAYLIAAYIKEFPAGTVFLGVVDPGVGTSRLPLVIKADSQWFIGPDNGLYNVICKRAHRVRRWVITQGPRELSASFHGRDLFAPMAAQLARGQIVPEESFELVYGAPWESWSDELSEIVYIDHFGNAMTGVRAFTLAKTDCLLLKGHVVSYARTFGEAEKGQPFWYENANGLVEIALREGNVSELLGLKPGVSFQTKSVHSG
jgi:S-adenosylmethionine hydrolase